MTTPDIQQAKEWAKESVYFDDSSGFASVVRVIQSLPNQWIDAEEVREIYDRYRDSKITLHEAFRAAVALIPAPAPRTLADMSLDELKTYVGGEVMVDGWANPTMLVSVIEDEGAVLAHRLNKPWPFVEVRPLSDLTPVTAPEQETENTPEPVLPRPEDVPPGEAWSVRYWGKGWIGVRADHPAEPWSIVSMDGLDYRNVEDSDVILMFRLVPEIKGNA